MRQFGNSEPTPKRSQERVVSPPRIDWRKGSKDRLARTTARDRKIVSGRHVMKLAGLSLAERLNRAYENLGNKDLPVYNKKQDIQNMISEHQISMIEGPTGSGKSTQIAQYALEMGFVKIVYLEPRVLLADNLSDRLRYELGKQLGAEEAEALVGARHSESSTGHGKTIEVMTPDTFLRVYNELEEFADEKVLIIGDEIHEKDFASELGVAVSANVLETHPKWRMTLMSATLDAASIQQAFGEASGNEVPIVSVEGRPFELEMLEEPELTAQEVYKKYGSNHVKTLLFTAGKQEIKDYSVKLRLQQLKNTIITPLHAKLAKWQIQRATSTTLKDGEKQIIPCTNAAQSGITIKGLTLVISDGTIRRQEIDSDGTEGLFKSYCAQDEMIQQAGRGGRDTAGALFISCKPDDAGFGFMPMDERDKHAPAQIYHTNIANNILAVAALGRDFGKLNEHWLVNKVKQQRVFDAYKVLYRLGALDEDNNITDIGMQMNKFPVRPELARALVEAINARADSEQIRQLAAMISCVGAGGLPYFEKNIPEVWRKDIRKETKDDYTAQLDMFLATRQFYDGQDMDERELQKRNYDLRNTRRAHRTYDKICRSLGYSSTDVPEAPTPDQLTELQGYLTAGLFDFVYHRLDTSAGSRTKTYVSVHDGKADTSRQRELSARGTYKGNEPLVVGFPRNFMVRKNGNPELRTTIETVFPTTQAMLANAALWLAENVPVDPTIRGGHLQQHVVRQFGDIALGESTPNNANFIHTPESKKLLMDEAFAKPGRAISELIAMKKRVEYLARRTPAKELDMYFPGGVLTQDWLLHEIESAITDDVTDVHSLDAALRAKIYGQGLSLQTWISAAHEQDILEQSPDFVTLVDGTPYQLHYGNGGEPTVQSFNLRDAEYLPEGEHWYLADGREIKISYAIGDNTRRWDIGAIRKLARSGATVV